MGYLLKLTTGTFEILWEGWQVPGAVKPTNVSEIRRATKIEERLESISKEVSNDTKFLCTNCQTEFKVADSEQYNFWRFPTKRELSMAAVPLFLEDEDFKFVKAAMSGLQPPQQRFKAFAAFWDFMDDVEKNWKGAEPELRDKLLSAIQLQKVTTEKPLG